MRTWISAAAAALGRHRRVFLSVVVVSLAVAGVGVARLELRQDVLSLLAGIDDGAHLQAAEALRRFGALDVLLVDVSSPGAPDRVSDLARAYAQDLRATGAFERVLFELDPAAMSETFEVLFDRRHYLFAPPADLGPGLEAAERDLMTPLAMMVEGAVARDPLDHRRRLVERLEGLAPKLSLDTSSGRLMSEDGLHALLVVEPRVRALDVTSGAALLERMHALAPDEAEVVVFGPHVFAAAAAAGIRRDVQVTIAGSLLGVIALFWWALRRFRYVVAATVPVVAGALWALGLIGASGRGLHGITLGFGAVMLGIGIDYGVHLLVHYRYRRALDPSEPAKLAIEATLGEVGPSIGIGALTTLVAFVVLLVSGTRALTEMVAFCGLGIAGALGFAMFVLPQLGLLLGGAPGPSDRPRAAPLPRWGSWWLIAAAGLTTALAVGAGKVAFDGDIRHLDYQPPEVRADEREIFGRYRPPAHPSLVVVSGGDREQALRAAERAIELLEQGQRAGLVEEISSAVRLLPSQRTQRDNLAAHDEALQARVRERAREVGLSPAYFDPFFEDLAAAGAGRVRPLTAEDLAPTPFGSLLRRGLHEDAEGTQVSILAHTGRAGEGPKRLAPQLSDALTVLGATVVSAGAMASSAVRSIKDAVAGLCSLSFVGVGWVLLFYYRRPRRALLALLPAGLGLIWAAGVMGWSAVPFNIVSVGAFALVSGVGVDYGVFVTDALVSEDRHAWPATRRSVLLAAATTLLGFGALIFADNPVMWSLGFAVAVGVASSLAVAVTVLPALFARGWGADEPVMGRGSLLAVGALAAACVALVAVWANGARSTHGWQVLLAISVNAGCIAWLVRRGAPRG